VEQSPAVVRLWIRFVLQQQTADFKVAITGRAMQRSCSTEQKKKTNMSVDPKKITTRAEDYNLFFASGSALLCSSRRLISR
jgi:hypothetical protein